MIPTLMLVKKLGIDTYFDDIYGIDKFEKHITKVEMLKDIINKYNLKQNETIMIGDAPTDMLAAKGAGIKGIGVLWGYGSNKEPLIQEANIVISKIDELNQDIF